MRRILVFASAMVLSSACGVSFNPRPIDTASDEVDEEPTWILEELGVGSASLAEVCQGILPLPRRYHQAAYFFETPPLDLTDLFGEERGSSAASWSTAGSRARRAMARGSS